MARVKAARFLRLLERPSAAAPGLLLVSDRGRIAVYHVVRLDPARVTLRKCGQPRVYVVTERPGRRSCDCAGYRYRGRCKHASALAALAARGLT